ncbi:MAG: hypothetical protein ACR2KJ_07595 [Jatrophihabitans sp.]
METKKIVGVVFVIFVIFFIVQSPSDAADVARHIGHGVGHMFDRLSEFLKNVT